ncbi:MAG TPA: hypothetical protein VLZ28_04960 [Daejeonella sp.]|nr:hypothetical protein [Daejeonella sp.]
MKRLLFSLLIVIAFASCQNEKPADQNNTSDAGIEKPLTESKDAEKTLDVPWIAVLNDSTQLLEIKKNPVAHPENLNEQDIIDALNLKYPQIKIEAVSREGNTAIVKIPNSVYLTQEMGSAGARAFLAEATYSLTEIDGIEAVDFRFEPGDHAMPGILTRKSFENFN